MQTAYIIHGELIDETTIKLSEPVPFKEGSVKVVLEREPEKSLSRKALYGVLKGTIRMADDFNEPLDCFREYNR